ELGAALDGIASGFADRGAELAAYFADPGAWNRQSTPRILDATLARAKGAAGAGKVARALSLAERILALDPSHADANALVSRLGVGARRRREATWLLGGVATIALGAVGFMALHRATTVADAGPRSDSGSVSGSDSGSGSASDAASASASVPDAASVSV